MASLTDKLAEALRVAICPNTPNGCDGEKYPVRGPDGEPEPERCQWCYERAALLREYEAAKGAEGWRPIETAPRDGTEILLAGRLGRHVCAWRQPDYGPSIEHIADAPEWVCTTDGRRRYPNPTCWMPLLPAPEHQS